MLPLSATELGICLIPAVIVIIIAIITAVTIRRNPTKTPEDNMPTNFQSRIDTDNGSGMNSPIAISANSQNGLATISLVISILALIIHVLFGPTWSNCMGPLAMIMGAMALLQLRKRGGKGKTVAMAGIVIGALPFIITLVMILFISADAVINK